MLQLIVCAVIAVIVSSLGSYQFGRYAKGKEVAGVIERENVIAALARSAAAEAAAAAVVEGIKGVRFNSQPVIERVTRELQTRVEYRSCVHPAGVLDDINAAITGRKAVSPSRDSVPKTGATERPVFRGDNAEAP